MKYNITAVIFIFFFSLQGGAKTGYSTKSVSVEIELEDLPNTEKYELEVKKNTEKKEKSLNFSQNEPSFKIKLAVGNYQVRTRIVSRQGEVGPWSEWSELLARPEEVSVIEIPNYNFSVRKNQVYADVKLQWTKAAGAEKYIIWVENQLKNVIFNESSINSEMILKLKTGEYKIGIQSVSKDGIKSKIKYATDSIFIAKTILPKIQVKQNVVSLFSWARQAEADVKIEIYRKAFFGEKYVKLQTLRQSGDSWRLAGNLQPGEYKIDFQYVSESFENGPIESVVFLKKPDENNFSHLEK